MSKLNDEVSLMMNMSKWVPTMTLRGLRAQVLCSGVRFTVEGFRMLGLGSCPWASPRSGDLHKVH